MLNIRPQKTHPYHPQTNGKIERFPHPRRRLGLRPLLRIRDRRRAALPTWMHFYNHHRHHSAIGDPPISRLNNLPGHHN
ncbi:integrase core domain-containing protein [Microbacterium maritypicum]|uniref:integrase core domain-containing protein n=1 Tax=Microbacterium maritypicum TaxID=33918 RepID=UPI00355778F7